MTTESVVIVTGASRGLGAAAARWLAQAGAAVTLVARSQENLMEVAADVRRRGGTAHAFKADVSDSLACRSAVETTLDHFGRIDSLVNNAGVVQPLAPIADTHPEEWRRSIEVNLLAPFYLVRAAIAELRRHNGRVVNVSSGAATMALATVSAYCTGKAALNHFTRVLAAEEKGVTALTVRPGVVDTDMQAVLRNENDNAMPGGFPAPTLAAAGGTYQNNLPQPVAGVISGAQDFNALNNDYISTADVSIISSR